jgi:CRP-like cAMP-binding protein
MIPSKQESTHIENRLLAALPQKDYKRLLSKMEEVSLERGQCLVAPGEEVRDVFFPRNAMISMVSFTKEGASVETGIVGNEGMLGIPVLFATTTTPMQSLVQIPGSAMNIKAKVLKREFDWGGAIYEVLLRYLHALVIQISQTAACNKLHGPDVRLARWLLMSSDSVCADELPLTHEFLSEMLGMRRAGITQAAGMLREKGLIVYRQGLIRIVDRKGLEEESCECYEVVEREYNRLFPPCH